MAQTSDDGAWVSQRIMSSRDPSITVKRGSGPDTLPGPLSTRRCSFLGICARVESVNTRCADWRVPYAFVTVKGLVNGWAGDEPTAMFDVATRRPPRLNVNLTCALQGTVTFNPSR